MLELEDARERILVVLPATPVETIPINEALGRIAAEPICAPIDLPGFDNSAMDGYAVRSNDLVRATTEKLVALKVVAESSAGQASSNPIIPGECIRVFTGSVLPTGADAVVMQEDTRSALGSDKAVLFSESVKPWENVRFRGEDVKRGALLLTEGDRVSIGTSGLLAAVGVSEVRVRRQPLVGLLSTGSELLEAGQPMVEGKIYESNRVTLTALLARAGARTKVFPLVADNLAATQSALEKAFAECDAVVTTGGASVGEHDYVKNAFERFGGSLEFWRVAIRPGKPFVFGRWREKFLFGLPGNPVSALVTLLLLVHPALLRWQRANDTSLPVTQGVLAEPLVNKGNRRHFMRVRIDSQGNVRSAGLQSSHILSSLAAASGLVDVPAASTLEAGTLARVMRWE